MTLSSIFHVVLTMSFLGSITALVILFFKKVFKNRITPTWHYLIWMILLVRLIIPYAPESSVSIFNFFTHYSQTTQEIQFPAIHAKDSNYINSDDIISGINPASSKLVEIQSSEKENLKTSPYRELHNSKEPSTEDRFNILNMMRAQNSYLPFKYQESSQANGIDFSYILGIIWLVGLFVSSSYILWIQISYNLKIKNLHHCTNENILYNYYNCKSQMKVKKRIPLILDHKIKTPSLMGIFNPKILISSDYIDLLTDDELRFVFMHELAHYKRKDIVVRWILIFLQVIHWFNPVLWFAFYKIRQDCETACDSHVLSCINSHEYKNYGNTMIKMLDIFSGYNYIPGATGMLNRKKFIVERVRNIINFKKPYVKWSLFGIVIFIVLTVFLLTNGKEPPKEVIKVSYNAEEIGESSGLKSIRRVKSISNEQLLVHDNRNHQFVVINTDGNSERVIDCEGLPEDKNMLFTIDSKSNLYVLSTTQGLLINIYDLMGKKIDEIELKDADIAKVDQIFKWDLEVDSKGNIYVLIPDTNIQVFDSNGSKIKTINQNGCLFIELDEEDNLYVGGYNDKDFIVKLNPLKDTVLWEIVDDNRLIVLQDAAYSKQSKSLYTGNMHNIISIDSEGKSINTVLHIDSLIQNYKSFIFRNFTIDSDENIYLYGFNRVNNESLLYRATTSKDNINSDNIKTITIAVRYMTPVLEYAVNKFENMHPDILINVENYNAFSWVSNDMTYEDSLKVKKEAFQKQYDFIQKINTQMLTGNGADIIQINSMPYREYADKNLLLDFNELMESDTSFDKNLYHTNILDALEYKDKLYTMPLSVSYHALYANEDFLKTHSIEFDDNSMSWNDFSMIAKEATKDIDGDGKFDMYGLPTIAPQKMFDHMMNSTTQNFIDYENRKAYFSSKEFIDLLKICKSTPSESYVNPEVTEFYARDGGFAFIPYTISDFAVIFGNGLMSTDEVDFYKYPNSNKNEYTFSSLDMYGINSTTKYKEETWEFVKFLISDEIQNYERLFGIPLNKTARENKVQSELKDAESMLDESGDVYGYKVSSPKEFKKQLKDNIEKLGEIIPKLNNCNTYDIQIQKILNEETENYFNGNKSAEETSQIIQRKVEMYLNE